MLKIENHCCRNKQMRYSFSSSIVSWSASLVFFTFFFLHGHIVAAAAPNVKSMLQARRKVERVGYSIYPWLSRIKTFPTSPQRTPVSHWPPWAAGEAEKVVAWKVEQWSQEYMFDKEWNWIGSLSVYILNRLLGLSCLKSDLGGNMGCVWI